MLAHLHELQSENRTMQSRIMELASQREFYIAINTRLRQTLADGSTNQIPNGLQTSGSSDSLVQSSVNPALQSSSPDFRRSASGEQVVSVPSPSPSLPAPNSAGSLSKQDQESLLHAHFLASSLPAHKLHPTPTNAHHPVRTTESPSIKPERPTVHSHPQPLGPYEHQPYSTHFHDGQPEHEPTNPALYNMTHVTNTVHAHMPPYVPVSMTTSEMDTPSGEHLHRQKH